MNITKSLLSLMLAGALFTGCKDAAKEPAVIENHTAATKSNTPVGKVETASFNIEGMTCAMGCAKTIESKLSHMDGIQKASVDFDKKSATVEYDSAKQSPEKITEAVEAVAGGDTYKVTNMKSSQDHAMLIKEKEKKKKKAKTQEKKAEEKKECGSETKTGGCCAGKKPASCHSM